MSARFKTARHTLTGSWEPLGGTAAGAIFPELDDSMDCGAIGLRAYYTNAGDIFWADEDGSEGGYLRPGDASGIELHDKFVYAKDFFLKGTVGDEIFITWLAP